MFRNSNNNQAMQLLMQGYSDSIKAKTSNQTLAMANAFNNALGNAVQTHDNHEQAMQNRETTRLQNEYMNRTMDDRVKHQAQQTKANELANEYTERTLDDRVLQDGAIKTGQDLANLHNTQLVNEGLQTRNYIADSTSKSTITSTNSQNYKDAAAANLEKEIISHQHAAYKGTPHYKLDESGQPYFPKYDKKGNEVGKEYISSERKAYIDETNKQMAATIKAVTQGETSRQQANTTALQAQTAQNVNDMNMQKQQKAQFDEAMGAIQASGDNYNDIFYKLGEAARNNEPEITLGNGTKMSVEMASIVAHGMGRGNGGGIGGGVNVNNSVKTTFKGDLANAINVLKNPNATSEELSAARSILLQDKNIQALNKKVNSYALLAQNAKDITDQDRLTTFQGFVTQYLGGDAASVYGNLKSKESMVLTELATNALKGALTERDMQIVRQQVQNLRKSGGFNEGVLRTMLDKMINEVEGAISTYETPHILAPDIYKKFESIKVLRGALD